jgi:hypothetical protein
MPDFVFPTSAELRQIAQDKLPRLERDRPIFQILPTEESDAELLMWDQYDNYTGLQQLRGLGGAPNKVTRVGAKRYITEPGVYGEFITIDEVEMTRRRKIGSFNEPADISELVMQAQDQLLQRRLDRIEYIGWNVLLGTFSVSGSNGVVHTDTYTVQTYNASTWGTAETATPLADFRAVWLKTEGHSVDFGSGAKAYMNKVTANKLLANLNDGDLYGKRTSGLANLLSMSEIEMLMGKEGLPMPAIYHGGYLDDNGVFQKFIPDDRVIVVGNRPSGQVVGNYRYTRNVNNPGMAPGPYMAVIDNGADGAGAAKRIPRTVEVHDGHNGGPVLFFPSAIVVMDVS